MPTPPACFTAALLFTRALTPRSHTTIFPLTLAGSRTGSPSPPLAALSAAVKHNLTISESAPRKPAAAASMRETGPIADATDAPLYVLPLPSVTDPRPLRLCVPSATVAIQGDGCATVPVVGP